MPLNRIEKDDGRDFLDEHNIIFASETDNVAALNRCIEAGADINFVEEGTGITPLHAASARNSMNVVQRLFEFGDQLDTSIKDRHGRTAYEVAIDAENLQIADFIYRKMFPENLPSQEP